MTSFAKTSARGDVPLRLFDPRRGDSSLRVEPIAQGAFRQPQRFNYFTILVLQKGRGNFHVDLQEFGFDSPVLLFANPYQILFLEAGSAIEGVSVQFHANFFCIETYHEEVGCNGVLFNDIHGQPLVRLDATRFAEIEKLVAEMEAEMRGAGLAQSELLISYLKVLLIKASRTKLEQQKCVPKSTISRPPILDHLFTLIESHYQKLHGPAEYAALLNLSPKALAKQVRTHLGKTLTTLIQERILKHAKWQLLHTPKQVKEIAGELGYADELYFSRLFKRATGFPPTTFREFELAIRSGQPVHVVAPSVHFYEAS